MPEGADCSGAVVRFGVSFEHQQQQQVQQQQQDGDIPLGCCLYVPAVVSANRQVLICVSPAFSQELLSCCLLRVDASLNGESNGQLAG